MHTMNKQIDFNAICRIRTELEAMGAAMPPQLMASCRDPQ